MDKILSIEICEDKRSGVVELKFLGIFSIIIAGVLYGGRHFQLIFKFMKYGISLHLHNYEPVCTEPELENNLKKGNG